MYSLAALGFAAAGLLWYAVRIEPRRLLIRRQVIELDPSRFPLEKLTILHISDLHVKAREPWKAWMIDRIRALEPDLIAVTGDFIELDSGSEFCAELVSKLRSRLGTYGVLGNHDYFHNENCVVTQILNALRNVIYFDPRLRNDVPTLLRRLEQGNVRILSNESIRLAVDDAHIWLAGVDDPITQQDDLERALEGVPREDFTILLSHSPESAFAARERGVDLVLAGHTHGGQVKIPLIGAVVSRTRGRVPVIGGMKRMGDTWLYVSAGLGASVPLRFLSPPEATLIELRRKSIRS